MKGILKWPLIVAAVVVVLRVITEQSGASDTINSLLSTVALNVLIGPVYFAVAIAKWGVARPYVTLFKSIFLYAVFTRAMVLVPYWLARIYDWPQERFGGVADSGPLIGWVAIPVGTGVFWILQSLVVGGLLGSITLLVGRRMIRQPQSTGIPSRP